MGAWLNSKLTFALTCFVGFEAAAWIVSKLVHPVHRYTTFLGASVFAATMLGVYLVTRREILPVSSTAPAKSKKVLFPNFEKKSLQNNSLYLVLNCETLELSARPFFQRTFKKIQFSGRPSSENLVQLMQSKAIDAYGTLRTVIEIRNSQQNVASHFKNIHRAVEHPWLRTLVRSMLPIKHPKPHLAGVIVLCPVAKLIAADAVGFHNEIAEKLLILGKLFHASFPLYVVATQSDKVPFFAEFFRNLSEEDAQKGSGVVFEPATSNASIGDAIGWKLNEWAHKLAARRLSHLDNEPDQSGKRGVFEHPREWIKLISPPPASNDLTPLGSALEKLVQPFSRDGHGPVLRAFHITGKIEDRPTFGTVVLGSYAGQQAVEPKRDILLNGAVEHIFLDDKARANFSMRSLDMITLVFVVLLGLVLVGSGRSWDLNRKMLADAHRIWVLNEPSTATAATSTEDSLSNLEQLRQFLGKFEGGGYEKRLENRWGLYQGDSVGAAARELYFKRFLSLILLPVRAELVRELNAFVHPTTETLSPYLAKERLRTYLTMHHRDRCKPNRQYAADLMNVWNGLPPRDPHLAELASKQVEFYLTQLSIKDPYSFETDSALVASVIDALQVPRNTPNSASGMIDDINHTQAVVRLSSVLEDLAEQEKLDVSYKRLMNGPLEMEPAYTRSHFPKLDATSPSSSRTDNEDACLAFLPALSNNGSGQPSNADLQSLTAAYVDGWKRFLADTHIKRFPNLAEAADRLDALTQNESPLLGALVFVSDNTSRDSSDASASGVRKTDARESLFATIDPQFQPVHSVMVPRSREWKNSGNATYVDALRSLAGRLRALARNTNDTSAKELARQAADDANQAVSKIKDRFQNGTSEVGTIVEKLLREPISNCQPFLKDVDQTAAANQALRSFCDKWEPVHQKFPFNQNGKVPVSERDLNNVFQPDNGALWNLSKQGSVTYKDGHWSSGSIQASSSFLSFLDRISGLGTQLFGTKQKKITIEVIPMNAEPIEVTLGGQAARSGQIDWPGPTPSLGLTVRVGSGRIAYPGILGVYMIELEADRSKPGLVVLRDSRTGGRAEVEVKDLHVSGLPEIANLTCPASATESK